MKCARGEFYRSKDTFADRIYCSDDTFAVADGMGTGEGGKLAAQKAVELVDRYRPFSSLEDIERFFKRANRKIMESIDRLGDRHMAGTTLSLLSLLEDKYMIGHVGDSRIYLWRDGKLNLLTEDQVFLKGGRKYVRALGIEWNPEVLLRSGKLQKGDIFLLISDGMLNLFSDKELESLIDRNVEESARRILEACRGSKSEEDLSFIIVNIK